MSKFKPTAPGWYWDSDYDAVEVVSTSQYDSDVKDVVDVLVAIVANAAGEIEQRPTSSIDWLAPVVRFEDGPGVNAIQIECVGAAAIRSNVGYAAVGQLEYAIKAMAAVWHGLSDDQRKNFPQPYRGIFQTVIMLGDDVAKARIGLRDGDLPAFSDPDPSVMLKVSDFSSNAEWYANQIHHYGEMKASEVAARRKERLSQNVVEVTTEQEGEG